MTLLDVRVHHARDVPGAQEGGADRLWLATEAGLFYGGGTDQLVKQAIATIAVLVYSLVVTYVIGWVIDKTIGFRVDEEVEVSGIDQAEHLESAYEHLSGGSTLGA